MDKRDGEEPEPESKESKITRRDGRDDVDEKKYSRYTSGFHAALRFVAQRGLLKAVAWSVVDVTVIGTEKLRGLGKSFVVVANHSSHLDTPLIMGSLPRDKARYLAAGAASDYFFDVGWRRGLTALFFNAFPVDRSGSNPRRISPRGLLDRGVPLLVFPEGTRSRDGKIGRFKPGSASLASSAGAPIVPVALIGCYQAHPRGSRWPKMGRLPVGVVYGEPMNRLEDETPAEYMGRVRDEVVRLYDEYADPILNAKSPAEGEPQ